MRGAVAICVIAALPICLGGCGDPATEVQPSASGTTAASSTSTTTTATSTTTTSTSVGSTTTTTTTAPEVTSTSTTGAADLRVAEELLVSLDAAHSSAGSPVWENEGTGPDFDRMASPAIVLLDDVTALDFNVEQGDGDAYRCQLDTPPTLHGVDPTRSVEIWTLNPTTQAEETMVAWSRRGGPNGSQVAFAYASNPDYGAVSHWGIPFDIGWQTPPAEAQWHHLAYTLDGTTIRVYVDGELDNEKTLSAGDINTHEGFPITIGAQNNEDLTLSRNFTGYIARVRVHAGTLSDEDVAANFEFERADFGL